MIRPAGDLFFHAACNRKPFILFCIVRDQGVVFRIIRKYPLGGFINVDRCDPGIGPPDHTSNGVRVRKDLVDKGLGRFIDNTAAHNIGPLQDFRSVECAVLHLHASIQQNFLIWPCDHQSQERTILEIILQIDNSDWRIGRQLEALVNDILHSLWSSHCAYIFSVRFSIDQIKSFVIAEHHIRMVLIVVGPQIGFIIFDLHRGAGRDI